MRIEYVEIANFRRLHAVRVELAEETTLFVGANNSGKTSAMLALRRFLARGDRNPFTIHDFTLSHLQTLLEMGQTWEDGGVPEDGGVLLQEWKAIVPSLDLWLRVEEAELHYVTKLIPTLDWTGGLLGVRLSFEPKEPLAVTKEYRQARESVSRTMAAAQDGNAGLRAPKLLWPVDMIDFLTRRMAAKFAVRAYLLDPSARNDPIDGRAQPQQLPEDAQPLDGNPLDGLVRIDEISAQRGLGDDVDRGEDDGQKDPRKLSQLLRRYYEKHLDPTDDPAPEDLGALTAIEQAQEAFDAKLETSFGKALQEVAALGYPGVADPKVTISTVVRPMNALMHSSAVQYDVGCTGAGDRRLRLPEYCNGLGYQNLISMSFRLMGFRDAWMRVGKAEKELRNDAGARIEPLHLVLVEEPEAHLHPQVQQVFIKKAYGVLRNHDDLRGSKRLTTQLVVSTHSSHVAHEIDFAQLRYFRRLPATDTGVPTSTVLNLSTVFGDEGETKRFVTRYIKAYHCDLLFADAAIFVEGAAERMLLPLFIRKHFAHLNRCFLSLLEIGGSHAHRLKDLVETLGLTTLIITDLDALAEQADSRERSAAPCRGADQTTSNATLKNWLPRMHTVDALLNASPKDKTTEVDMLFAVRVAYQCPISVSLQTETAEALPYTFEDALVLTNIAFFGVLKGNGMVRSARKAIEKQDTVSGLSKELFENLDCCKKAEFALDVISAPGFDDLRVPEYIREGLEWLEARLKHRPLDVAQRESGRNGNHE